MSIRITQAQPSDAPLIAGLVGDLLREIMAAIETRAFEFSLTDTEIRARGWVTDGSYTVLLAHEDETAAGFLSLSECRALYAEG